MNEIKQWSEFGPIQIGLNLATGLEMDEFILTATIHEPWMAVIVEHDKV